MNPPAATFADFPVELSEHVILLAAHAYALDDKPSLAALARASRSIHALVQPILVETVIVTSSNLRAILTHAAPAGVFATTHSLVVENLVDGDQKKLCTSLEQGDLVLSEITVFYGPAAVLYALAHFSSPRRVVLVPGPQPTRWFELSDRQLFNLTRVTHIHGGEDLIYFLTSAIGHWKDPALWDAGIWLTHVVLAGIDLDVAVSVVPLLMLIPKLDHICILSWEDKFQLKLQSIVDSRKEDARLRLWVDDSNVHPYDRRMVLNDEYWSIGTPFSARNTVLRDVSL